MPHHLIPPDLQVILDWNDPPFCLRGTSGTVLCSRPWSREQNEFVADRLLDDVSLIPEGTRAVTAVHFIPAEHDNTYWGQEWGTGIAYLSADDLFREDVGILLATIRALTDLLETFRPLNAYALCHRVERWYYKIGGQRLAESLDTGTYKALQKAVDRLGEAAQKCRK